jgi:hypothetical protein
MRKAFAFHLAGDQHLGSVYRHGVDDFNDSIYSFCVPSIANLYLRWWDPLEPGKNRKPGAPDYTGEHFDGFGNRLTVHAVANPDEKPASGDKLTTRAAGFGIVRLNKKTRQITMECWPRNVDITDPANKPYPGWPVTIHQTDNYGRKAAAWLPTLVIKGQTNPVVQIIDEACDETVYTLHCVTCKAMLNSQRFAFFSALECGLFCSHCGKDIKERVKISGGTIATINYLASKTRKERLAIQQSLQIEIRNLLRYYISFLLSKELKMWKYL